jgi:MATE family multidrug resistance protein
LLFIAAIFHIFDGLQVVGLGILRGMKDPRVPMYIAVFSYWLVGVPAAYLLAFVFDMGGIGVWVGITFGLVTAAAALLHRFMQREYLCLLPEDNLL